MTAIALTIAGSDSSGGAGIQADLKTFAAHQVYGASVIVALTAQNTKGVSAIHAVPRDFVAQQMDAVFEDLDVGAVKIGMLATAELIETVAAGLKRHGAKNIVLTIIREGVSDGIGGTNSGQVHEGWLSQPLDAGHSRRSLAILRDLPHDHLAEGERAEVRDCMGGAYIACLYEYMVKAREAPRYPGLLGHNSAPIGDSAVALMALAMSHLTIWLSRNSVV